MKNSTTDIFSNRWNEKVLCTKTDSWETVVASVHQIDY